MPQLEEIECPICRSHEIVKNGKNSRGTQGYRCKSCRKCFQTKYYYSGCQQGVSDQIVEMSMNGSGIRDTGRVLNISTGKVLRTLKKGKGILNVNEYYLKDHQIKEVEIVMMGPEEEEDSEIEMVFEFDSQGIDRIAEADEMWSYVGKKSNPVWLWYAIERSTGVVLAFIFGKRQDEVGQRLCELLKLFPIHRICTDSWGTYSRCLPKDQHQVGKSETWRIERKNLTLRTHIKRLQRKTICFSKCQIMHEAVIGLYINKYHFKAA